MDRLQAESLRLDPRVAEARALLQSAFEDHRSRLTGVRQADPERQSEYAAKISEFSQRRGGKLFYPYLGSGLGNGPLVELADGSVKYDLISGIGVHVFGHSDPDLLQAGIDAALGDTVMQGNLQQNEESAALCADLIDLASESGAPLQHCFLSTSGAMANENALKMLFQARAPASRLLAFSNCFAGRSLALSQVTDRPKNRAGLPTLLAVDYVPFYDPHQPEQSRERAKKALQEHLERYPGQHAGMIMELIQGEGGSYPAPREFFVDLLQSLREAQVPILFDEIQTFGRTSRPFAFQTLQLDEFADMATVGKMTQACATLFRTELKPQPGLISQTFTGATSSIMAALHILQRLRRGGYWGPDGRVMQVHSRFVEHFERIRARAPAQIRGPWGAGGMLALTVFDGGEAATKRVLEELFTAGVIAFSAGADPTRIRMLPPLAVISDEQIDEVCAILEGVLQTVADELAGS